MYVYDLDGTLVDTKEAVRSAYLEVGITPPDDFFGKTWREWLPDEEAHDKKNDVYKNYLFKVKALPLMAVFKVTGGSILTGASRHAASLIIGQFDMRPEFMICSMSLDDKIDHLNQRDDIGIFFENDFTAASEVRRRTKWAVCHVQY